MILKIRSQNNHLPDLLFKNPQTDRGLYFKPLKNGIIAGNIVSPNEYEVVFQDTKYSYLPEDSNQLDFQSYCSPLTVMHICTELFNHILKDKETFCNQPIEWLKTTQGAIDTKACTIEIPTFFIDSSWYRDGQFLLSRYFDGITVVHQKGKNFQLCIEGASIFEAFNLLNLVALFIHITNEYGLYTYIDDSFAEKYVRILTNIDHVPYFVFYLFIKRTVKSLKQFELVKPLMEAYLAQRGIVAELTYYGTQQGRQHFITSRMDKEMAILDIGCGELAYYRQMMNKGFKSNYYAVDEEIKFKHLGEAIASRYEAQNLSFYQQLEEVPVDEKLNIIMSEVIEHNSLEEAIALVKQALKFDFNQIIITTPNAEFNPYYYDDGGFRHDDHHFELTHKEFVMMMQSCVAMEDKLTLSFEQIGDKLNGVQPTQACIITRKD